MVASRHWGRTYSNGQIGGTLSPWVDFPPTASLAPPLRIPTKEKHPDSYPGPWSLTSK